jgi:transcriptional regulator with XRE-family HTH domain
MVMIKKNVRKYCKLRGISQAALAREVGVSRQAMSRRMNNDHLLTIGFLKDAAAQLGCTLADLMGYDGDAQEKLDAARIALDD